MKRNRFFAAVIVGALTVSLATSPGCIGNFKMTKDLDTWNKSMEGKWVQEGLFIPLVFVYAFVLLGDMIIFNSIEFWSGDNILDQPEEGEEGEEAETTTRTFTEGDSKVVLTKKHTHLGPQMGVQIFEKDRLVDEFVLLHHEDGTVVKQRLDGETLATAKVLSDGGLFVEEAGRTTVYSKDDLDQRIGR